MKHLALSLIAAACGALSASAVDATNARIWLDEKIQPDFAAIGSGIASEKYGTAPAYARNWQYVSIPVHVEGAAKGEAAPHFIPALTVRISLAVATTDAKGKPADAPELLTKEITYVDIPLAKAKRGNTGEGLVNVGVFISPSNAFKLSQKDGNLAKKLIAVAVEGTFEGSPCNRVKEKANDGVTTAVVVDTKAGRGLANSWWTKKGGDSGAMVAAISETPFAHEYARLGFPATNPLYGAGTAVSTPAVAPAPAATGASAEGPTAVSEGDSTHSADADGADDTSADGTDDSSGSSKRKGKKSRRSSRR